MNGSSSSPGLVKLVGAGHHEMLVRGLWQFVTTGHRVDFGFQGALGRKLLVHQLVLDVFAPPLSTGLREMTHLEVWGGNLDALLRFMYIGEVDVQLDMVINLLQLARHMQFQLLVDVIEAKLAELQSQSQHSSPAMVQRHFNQGALVVQGASTGNLQHGPSVVSLNPKGRSNEMACVYCSFRTSDTNAFQVHRALHDPSVTVLKCAECPSTFLDANLFRQHTILEHGTTQVSYGCPYCRFRTSSEGEYQLHRVQHDLAEYTQSSMVSPSPPTLLPERGNGRVADMNAGSIQFDDVPPTLQAENFHQRPSTGEYLTTTEELTNKNLFPLDRAKGINALQAFSSYSGKPSIDQFISGTTSNVESLTNQRCGALQPFERKILRVSQDAPRFSDPSTLLSNSSVCTKVGPHLELNVRPHSVPSTSSASKEHQPRMASQPSTFVDQAGSHLLGSSGKIYGCSDCSFSTNVESDLLMHWKAHHKPQANICVPEYRYHCAPCRFSTNDAVQHVNHLIACNQHGTSYTCNLCKQRFATADLLRTHATLAHAVPEVCSDLSNPSPSDAMLDARRLTKNGQSPPRDGRIVAMLESASQDLESTSIEQEEVDSPAIEKNFKEEPDFDFEEAVRDELEPNFDFEEATVEEPDPDYVPNPSEVDDVASKTGSLTKEFLCTKCSFGSRTTKGLTMHNVIMHPKGRRKNYRCSKCSFASPNSLQLARHMKLHATTEKRLLGGHQMCDTEAPFLCSTCHSHWPNQWFLDQHAKSHANPSNGRSQSSQSTPKDCVTGEFQSRIMDRTGDGRKVPPASLVCSICDYELEDEAALAAHSRRHLVHD